jgi:hypothetical protein
MVNKLNKEVINLKDKKNYTPISNSFSRDERLTPQERGVFSFIFSGRLGSDYNKTKIAKSNRISTDTLEKIIKQLEKYNYVYRALYSSTVDKNGRINNKYNDFFSDEGNAKEYYLSLVKDGIIDERGKYLKRQIDENTTDYLEQIKNKAIKYIELQKLSPIDVIGIIDITEKHIEKNYNEAYIDDLSSMEYIDRQSIKKSAIVQLKEKNIEKFVNNLINKNK